MDTPKFSIIIPLYNKERTIQRTLNSVLSQSYQNFEIVIIDDGSTDNSVQAVRQLKDSRIKLSTKPNGGPSSARNMGIDKATGEWILFLDADDELMDGALRNAFEMISKHHDIDVLACNFVTRVAGHQHPYFRKQLKEGVIHDPYKDNALARLSLRTGAAFFRSEKIKSLRFDERIRRYEDMAFNMEVFATLKIYRSNICTLIYDRSESEASKPRKNPEEDYICHLQMKREPFFYGLIIYRHYKECTRLYPEIAKQRYAPKDFDLLRYYVVDIIVRGLKKLKLL